MWFWILCPTMTLYVKMYLVMTVSHNRYFTFHNSNIIPLNYNFISCNVTLPYNYNGHFIGNNLTLYKKMLTYLIIMNYDHNKSFLNQLNFPNITEILKCNCISWDLMCTITILYLIIMIFHSVTLYLTILHLIMTISHNHFIFSSCNITPPKCNFISHNVTLYLTIILFVY